MKITKYAADGTPISSGLIAVTFTATPTGVFDSSVSTTSGIAQIALSLDNQTGNVVLASPSDGSTGTPGFRALVAADIPNISAAKITSGTLAAARGGTGLDTSGSTGYAKIAAGTWSAQAVPIPIADGGTNATTSQGAINNIAQTTTKGDLIAHNGTNNVRLAAGTDGHSLTADSSASAGLAYKQRLARRYRDAAGFTLHKLDAATLYVSPGMVEVNGALVEVTTLTKLGMATGSDWIGGSSGEGASLFVWIYIDGSGNIKLHSKAPTAPTPAAAVATALVNQAGWNGTAGSGLNATSVVYDGDTGEGSITEGMLALIYASTDSDYSVGRGRGSAAAGSANNVSAALITAVNTGTNTLTLEAGHQIAINDNDRIAVVPFGQFLYRQESSTWYRLIGMMYNDASSNLEQARQDTFSYYVANEASDFATTSASWGNVDATRMAGTTLSDGGVLCFGLSGVVRSTTSAGWLDVAIDGNRYYGDDGIYLIGASTYPLQIHRLVVLLPGTHTITLQWRVSGGTMTLYAGAGTASLDVHPQFYMEKA